MDIFELIGFIIGDGNIYYNPIRRVYRLELVGNVEEDYDYFDLIEDFLIRNVSGSKPFKFIRKEPKGKSLRIQLNNKQFVDYLIGLGLPKGKKTFDISIPLEIYSSREKMISLVRGVFEADGCLYFSFSKKIAYPSYPRIEIKTSSPMLVKQLRGFFLSEGFKVYVKKGRTFSLQISGESMLNLWKEKIGFPSLKNKTKYALWKSKGFYTPYTNLKNRLELI